MPGDARHRILETGVVQTAELLVSVVPISLQSIRRKTVRVHRFEPGVISLERDRHEEVFVRSILQIDTLHPHIFAVGLLPDQHHFESDSPQSIDNDFARRSRTGRDDDIQPRKIQRIPTQVGSPVIAVDELLVKTLFRLVVSLPGLRRRHFRVFHSRIVITVILEHLPFAPSTGDAGGEHPGRHHISSTVQAQVEDQVVDARILERL